MAMVRPMRVTRATVAIGSAQADSGCQSVMCSTLIVSAGPAHPDELEPSDPTAATMPPAWLTACPGGEAPQLLFIAVTSVCRAACGGTNAHVSTHFTGTTTQST